MPSETSAHASAEAVSGASVAQVGAGVVTFALAPLALPILILTVVAVIPLLLPVLALGLMAAIVTVPIRLARGLRRPTVRPPRPNAQLVSDVTFTAPRPGSDPIVVRRAPRALATGGVGRLGASESPMLLHFTPRLRRNTQPTFSESLRLEPERPVEPRVVSAAGGQVSFEVQGPRYQSPASASGRR
jgi:hypothetical protein